ncbi:MAG TPA: TonB-dependent receptor, partial [bacterium]|nr:TonB-dependent receptor [bacterium]
MYRIQEWWWRAVAVEVAVLVMVWAGGTAAQEPALELEEVVVTAQRYATPELTTPAHTTVISGDVLARSGGRTVTEALRATGGFDYVAYSPLGINQGGMNSELPIRGVPDGELVLIDGLPLQNPSGGGYDLNTIPLAAIERVEIVKGSASTLYGSAAMTGVINIITRQPQGPQGTLQSEGGNNAYARSSITGGGDAWLVTLNHTHLGAVDRVATSYTSFWEYDQMPTDDYGAMVRVTPLPGLTLGWLGSQEQTGFARNPWTDRPVRAANTHKGTVQESNRNLATLACAQDGFSLTGAYLSDLMWYDVDDGTGRNATDFFRWSVNPQYHGTSDDIDYLLGGEWQGDKVKSSAYGARRRQNASAYGTVTVHPLAPLAVTLGGRQQWVRQKDAADYSTFTPQAQASWQVDGKIAVYANAGRAFRAPDLTRLYRSTALLRGNPDLKPEQG